MSPDILDRPDLVNLLMHVSPAGVLWLVVKATVLLAAAALVQCAIRRRGSAAARHLVWTLALASLVLLPLATAVLPHWALVVRSPSLATAVLPPAATVDVPAVIARGERPAVASPSPAPTRTDVAQTPFTPAAPAISWTAIAAAIYIVVSGLLVVRLIVERWRVRRFASRAAAVTDEAWLALLARCANNLGIAHPVRLLRSVEPGVPAALGTVRPAIVIPAIAETWTDDRRRAVLLHELAHVARWDCFTQGLAAIVCAVYWFHPAAWWIARRLRVERELACDDCAIAAGTEPREYAGHLLEIAYAFGRHRAPALAVSMARRSQIEGRLLAALDAARNRTIPAVRVRIAAAIGAAVLLLLIAAARPTAVAAEFAPEAMATMPPVAAPEQGEKVRGAQAQVQEAARRLLRAAVQAAGVEQDGLPGTWEIRPTTIEGTVHLRLVEFRNSSGTNVRLADLDGLSAAQLAAGGPVQFRVRRDAGTFTFEGVARGGVAAGTFSFAPDPAFAGELAKRGFARPSATEQYQLARHDIGFAFVDELTKQGYAKPSTSELVRAGQHGVNLTYLREMGALGHRFNALDPLITLRDHGVSPDYIRGLEAEGYKGLSSDALRTARDHGISPDYVRGMRDAGYGSLTMEALIKARDHGVSPEYARQLADLGHRKLPLEELIRVRDHGVSVEYARGMRELGHDLPIDGLVRARDHGVSVEYVRDLTTLGYKKLPIETLIRMRDHGVGADYVRELQALGYKDLSVDDLVGMRDHGLSIDRIRNANARAGTRLPLDLLKSLVGMR